MMASTVCIRVKKMIRTCAASVCGNVNFLFGDSVAVPLAHFVLFIRKWIFFFFFFQHSKKKGKTSVFIVAEGFPPSQFLS